MTADDGCSFRFIVKKRLPKGNYLVNLIETRFRGLCGIIYWYERQPGPSLIIHSFARNDCVDVSENLRSCGIESGVYHGGMTASDRESVQRAWMVGKFLVSKIFNDEFPKIMVATIAFGMGIDKCNVRFVIHTTMPKSIENYYQVGGRKW